MRSAKSKFKFIPRGFSDTAVLIPGWASDCRIFSSLNLPYNYLLPVELNLSDFEKELLLALERNSLKNVHLLGWSLGGFLSAGLAAKNPLLVKEMILLSIAREFDSNLLKEIAQKLKKNKRAYLYKFYRDCFSAEDKAGWRWFKNGLLNDYINTMDAKNLISGLEYLFAARLMPAELSRVGKIRIFHGEDDRIMPFSHAAGMISEFKEADFTPLSGIGHVCFLNPGFRGKFSHG